jgi:hypothetical protein
MKRYLRWIGLIVGAALTVYYSLLLLDIFLVHYPFGGATVFWYVAENNPGRFGLWIGLVILGLAVIGVSARSLIAARRATKASLAARPSKSLDDIFH